MIFPSDTVHGPARGVDARLERRMRDCTVASIATTSPAPAPDSEAVRTIDDSRQRSGTDT